MKKIYTYLFILTLGVTNAQTKENKFMNGESQYDSWALSLFVGPSSIYTGDLRTDETAFKLGIAGQLGVTKWFNHAFGVEGLLQFGKTRQTNATPNLDGNTKYLGLSFNGMLNLNTVFRRGDLVGNRKWNAYVYAGMGFMDFTARVRNTKTNVTTVYKNNFPRRSAYVQGGAILSRRLNDNFDISARANFMLNGRDMFDGVASTKHANAQERLLTASIGITYHFGTKEKLVWSDPYALKLKDALSKQELNKPVNKILNLNDDDNDGVVNEFDKEPNTLSNAVVDGAGRALDTDNDGVADGIDKCPLVKGEQKNNGCPSEVSKKIVQENELDALNLSLRGIQFDTSKAIIKTEFYSVLNNAVSVVKKLPNQKFMITGYTDCLGNLDSNQKLSERRANSVKNYLIKNGVSKSQIFVNGLGENSPLHYCSPCNSCSKEEHKENRRIEIKILN
ncbi:OmpA family protein [Polaribacter staleyi]|uniref:OmpA family protein n=1 Tax=Polaribacter staleyi TaxID=2022337 RepID=UPI0031BAF4F3